MMFRSRQSRLDHCLPAMLLAAGIKGGYEGPMEAAEMAERLESLLFQDDSANDKTGETRRRPGGPVSDDAFFAACAYIDEALMNSAWPRRDQWPRHSLARRHFNTLQAGTEFFDRLTRLLNFGPGGIPNGPAAAEPRRIDPAPDRRRSDPWRESLEVFAAALSLGFCGRHYGPDGLENLELIRRNVAEALGPPLAAEAGRLPVPTAPAWVRPKKKRARSFIAGALPFVLPLIATLFFMAFHRSMLARFTLDWARALGVLP